MKAAPLGEIADIVSGATPKTGVAEYWDGDIPWVTPADLSKLDGPYISETPRTLTDTGVKSCATTILPAGSVLLSSRAPIGHVAINTVPMATNQGFKSLVPGADLDAKYLYHWLKSKTEYLQSLGNGATFKELSKKTTEQVAIPLPSLVEQRRIATILDHADVLRIKRSQALAHLDSLAQAVFRDAFGTRWNGPRVDLEQLATVVTKGTTPTSVGLSFSDRGVPFLRAQNLQNGTVDLTSDTVYITEDAHKTLKRSWIEPEDLLISIAGTIGRVALVPPDSPSMNCNQAVAIIRLASPATGRWLLAWLNSHDAKAQIGASSVTATISNLSLGQIRKFQVPAVSPTAIEDFVSKSLAVSVQRELMEKAIAADDELFSAVQGRAFRGEL